MRRSGRAVCGLAIAALGLAVAVPRAHACSCAAPPPPAEARDAAAAVFEGFVLGSVIDQQSSSRTVQFQVMRVWKGVQVDTVLYVQTPAYSAGCGVEPSDDQLVLVYASDTPTGLRMVLCSRTAPSAVSADDFAALGPPVQVGVLSAGALRGTGGAAGSMQTGGAGGAAGSMQTGAGGAAANKDPVHSNGCAVGNGRTSVAAIGLAVALATAVRRRQQRRPPDRKHDGTT